MPSDQLHVPALPILLPLGVLLMAVSVWHLRRRGLLTAARLGTAWFAAWYLVAVIGATLLPLDLAWGAGAGPPELFRIILVPLSTMRVDDFVLNVAMTLPLAALLHLVAGVRDRRRVVLIAFLLSAAIEVTQGVLVLTSHGNRWADVNDLIANTSGAWLGHVLFRQALGIDAVRRLAARCTIPVAPSQMAPRVRK
jgi:glycopeptide antibiotics resistance protein